ncbi:MAG: hypothetical protein PGN11_05425 [Quadrisphaera sp.]
MLILLVVGLVGAFGNELPDDHRAHGPRRVRAGGEQLRPARLDHGDRVAHGALLAARREKPRLRLVVGAATAFGVFAIIASVMPGYWTFALALIPVGLSALTLMTAANGHRADDHAAGAARARHGPLHGRLRRHHTPLGAPLVGWIGEVAGPRWSIAVGGIAALVAAAVVVLVVSRRQEVHVSYRLHARPHLLVEVGSAQEPVPAGLREAA